MISYLSPGRWKKKCFELHCSYLNQYENSFVAMSSIIPVLIAWVLSVPSFMLAFNVFRSERYYGKPWLFLKDHLLICFTHGWWHLFACIDKLRKWSCCEYWLLQLLRCWNQIKVLKACFLDPMCRTDGQHPFVLRWVASSLAEFHLFYLIHRSEAVCPAHAKTVLILLKINTSHHLAFDKVSVLLVQKCFLC